MTASSVSFSLSFLCLLLFPTETDTTKHTPHMCTDLSKTQTDNKVCVNQLNRSRTPSCQIKLFSFSLDSHGNVSGVDDTSPTSQMAANYRQIEKHIGSRQVENHRYISRGKDQADDKDLKLWHYIAYINTTNNLYVFRLSAV